jgi:hypothetical protein
MIGNQVAELCAGCSVEVLPGGGVVTAHRNGPEVRCRCCADAETAGGRCRDIPYVPAGPPPGCNPTIWLEILIFEPLCWRCRRPALCLAGLYPAKPAPGYYRMFTCDDQAALLLARDLADSHGHHDATRSLRRHDGDFQDEPTLVNTCRHCDTPFDDLGFAELLIERAADTGLAGFSVLTVAECPTDTWQRLVQSDASMMPV